MSVAAELRDSVRAGARTEPAFELEPAASWRWSVLTITGMSPSEMLTLPGIA